MPTRVKGPLLQECSLYRNAFLDNVDDWKNTFVQNCKKLEVRTLEDAVLRVEKARIILPGEARLRKFEEILENGYVYTRHIFQKEFHDEIVKAMGESIVGDDWARVGPYLSQQRGWTKTGKAVMGMAPRRFGKSISVAQVVIARAEVMIVHDPVVQEDVQAIFSTGRRASTNLLQYCYHMALERGLGPRIRKFNDETLWIAGGEPGDPTPPMAKIYSYPSNAKIDETLVFFFSFFSFFFFLFLLLPHFFFLMHTHAPPPSPPSYTLSLTHSIL